MYRCVLCWFQHVERVDEECMAKKVIIPNMERNRCRNRTRLCWMDGVKRALGERGISVEQGRMNALGQEKAGVDCEK